MGFVSAEARARDRINRRLVLDIDTSFRPSLLRADVEQISRMPASLRAERVRLLKAESRRLYWRGRRELIEDRELVGIAGLFSGGNDSTIGLHMMRGDLTHLIHANTGIGIEATRDFVRATARAWGVPLIELTPPPGCTYREMVLAHGFPGPGQHYKMFQRLKERALHAARDQLITRNKRQRVIFIAGRRRDESMRRADVPILERRRTIAYISPLANWTKLDLNTYRLITPGVPRNPVADLLHMSGECLCGSFAGRGELDEIAMWFPDVAEEIRDLERDALVAARAGRFPIERARWGWGAYRKRPPRPSHAEGIACGCAPQAA